MRIVSRLIAKEHAAHRALGDVASVMGLYSESDEEEHVRDALRKRTAAEREQALEEAAPEPAGFDPWAFAGLARPGTGAIGTRPRRRRRCPWIRRSSLFGGDDDYLAAAVQLTFPSPANGDLVGDRRAGGLVQAAG